MQALLFLVAGLDFNALAKLHRFTLSTNAKYVDDFNIRGIAGGAGRNQ
jgi:hypothetical protein